MNRWPSAVASHALTGAVLSYSLALALNSTRGVAVLNGDSETIGAERNCCSPISPDRYSSSRPFDVQSGSEPPAAETRTFSPGPGYGCTYTSGPPDSLDAYAIQRPSGENAACHRLKRDSSNSIGFLSPVAGITQSPLSPFAVRSRP